MYGRRIFQIGNYEGSGADSEGGVKGLVWSPSIVGMRQTTDVGRPKCMGAGRPLCS